MTDTIKNNFIPADLKKDFSAAANNDLALAKRLWAFVMTLKDAANALRKMPADQRKARLAEHMTMMSKGNSGKGKKGHAACNTNTMRSAVNDPGTRLQTAPGRPYGPYWAHGPIG